MSRVNVIFFALLAVALFAPALLAGETPEDDGDDKALAEALKHASKDFLARPLPNVPDTDDASVDDFLKLYQTEKRKRIAAALRRYGEWRERLAAQVKRNAMPDDVLALVFVESAYKPRALSRSDAAGFWQILPTTARFFGMRRDAFVDERFDPEKATDFGCWYLRELYSQFEDWPITLASYNLGRGGMARLLESGAPKDFFKMRSRRLLRQETADYVPQILAARRLLADPKKYGFDPPDFDKTEYESLVLRPLTDIPRLESLAGAPGGTILRANPGLRGEYAPPDAGGHRVMVPKALHDALEKANLTANAVADFTQLRGMTRKKIKIDSKITLWSISRQYDTCLASLRAWNGLAEEQNAAKGDEVIVYVRDDYRK